MNLSIKTLLLSIPTFFGSTTADYTVPHDAICLTQDDFVMGTKIISTPGVYKLCGDITFNPNAPAFGETPSENAFDPTFKNYAKNEFGLGFFAALAIACDDVTLHLNGYTIEQSAPHALMQRFFAVIELANSPFIPNAGPAQFVSNGGAAYAAANNVKILGPGTIGRSSHHGIHGNDNSNVEIAAVVFRDFEVAAVALNNVDNLVITENTILGNRHDVPVTGLFSAARFIRPYGKYLKFMNYVVKDENGTVWKTAEQAYDDLMTSINRVYHDVVYDSGVIDKVAHPREHHLFDNPLRAVDGPCYAFLVHGRGPAVGGMGEQFNDLDATVTSSNIEISNNIINNIKCWNNEVPALFGSCGHHGCIQNDPRGAVFQTIKTYDSYDPYLAIDAAGHYLSNPVADMQLIVASAILDGTLANMPERQIGPNSINQATINWAKNGGQMIPQYVCNGDSMHHVVKGVIPIRVEDSEGFSVSCNIITNVENLSVKPFANCHDYHIGASHENFNEQQLGNIRAISVAATRGYTHQESLIKNNYIGAISSTNGHTVIGIDIQGDSDQVKVTLNKVDLQDTENILTTSEEVAMDSKNTAESTVSALKQVLRKDIKQTLEMVNLEEQQSLFDSQQSSATDTIGPTFIAFRVRELVGYVNEYNNIFLQPIQMLNVGASTARKLWKAPHPRPPTVSGDVEWSYGGCPFHENYYDVVTP